MNRVNSIVINAPLHEIFSTASDLARWPDFLSHYRYNRFISQMPWGGIVKMCCVRSGITTTWISKYRIDTEKRELQFLHLKAAMNATRGMEVIWNFEELPSGEVKVSITHDLVLNWPIIGGLVADWVVGWYFIHYIAGKTLAGLKRKLESQSA